MEERYRLEEVEELGCIVSAMTRYEPDDAEVRQIVPEKMCADESVQA